MNFEFNDFLKCVFCLAWSLLVLSCLVYKLWMGRNIKTLLGLGALHLVHFQVLHFYFCEFHVFCNNEKQFSFDAKIIDVKVKSSEHQHVV